MKSIYLLTALALATACPVFADLDEEHFQNYSVGDLLGQNGWSVDAAVDTGFAATPDRVEIKDKEDQETGKSLVWKSGVEQAFQARAVKRFPATTSPKVEIILSVYISEEPQGLLYFDQPGVGSVMLYFIRGKITVMSGGGHSGVSAQNYYKQDWSNIRLKIDFEAHTAELFMEENSVGVFGIDANLTEFSQVNLFAGSPNEENRIGNLVVRSIEPQE